MPPKFRPRSRPACRACWRRPTFATFAPAGTPRPILDRLDAVTQQALADEPFQNEMLKLGFEPAPGIGPDRAAAVFADERVRWTPILKSVESAKPKDALASLPLQRDAREPNLETDHEPPVQQPILDKRGEPHVRRFEEQRWLLDNIIRANGIDWDQPRSLYLSGPCGNEANADFAGIRERVKKMADIGPAFEAVARRREAKANAAARGRPPGHRARQLLHGGGALGRGAVALRPERRDQHRLQQQEARVLHQVCGARRSSRRGGVGAVQGQGDPGVAAPAAGLHRRPDSGGDLDPRHGQLQGNPGRALRRPLPQPRHGGAGDRRSRANTRRR